MLGARRDYYSVCIAGDFVVQIVAFSVGRLPISLVEGLADSIEILTSYGMGDYRK
jgi:hypothetical protein